MDAYGSLNVRLAPARWLRASILEVMLLVAIGSLNPQEWVPTP